MICEQLNFEFFDTRNTNTTLSKTGTSQKLQQDILKQTGMQTSVKILPVRGDGNCLFRALSLAITNNQRQHSLFRTYIVNHIMDDSIRHDMHELHQQKQSNADLRSYVVNMQRQGTWGTDQEIVAAANLFHCSITCYSKYSSTGQFCLQHFPPHFPTMPHCTSTCCHPSLYLINSSGYHYKLSIVRLSTNDIQQMDVEP